MSNLFRSASAFLVSALGLLALASCAGTGGPATASGLEASGLEGPDAETMLREGFRHPLGDERRPAVDVREIRTFRVLWRQIGLNATGSLGPTYNVDAAIVVGGQAAKPPRDGIYRANILFYGSHRPPYLGRVKRNGNIVWVYLPLSDYDRILAMVDGGRDVEVTWTKRSDGREFVGIVRR